MNVLYNIFKQPTTGLRIIADDGLRVLDTTSDWLDLQKDPYSQEGKGDNRPQVIIGPAKGVSSDAFIGLGSHEMHMQVEVRIITRDHDDNGMGYTLNDGEVTCNKVRDAVVLLVEANKSNPGGDGSIVACWVAEPGSARNEPDGPPKWVLTMQVEFMWLL